MRAPDRGLANLSNALVREISQNVADDIDLVLARGMKLWAQDLRRSTVAKKELKSVNERVASGARGAVLNSYMNSGIGKRPSYRTTGRHKRYAGEAMQAALTESNYIKSDAGGIRFGNKKALDRQAAQWYRLNFGAGGKASGGQPPAQVPMKFFRREIGKKVNLSRYKPSKAFNMPAGFFSSSFNPSNSGRFNAPSGVVGSDAFYLPGRGQSFTFERKILRKRPTQGIKAHHFLEAGANYINAKYPEEIERMTTTWHREALRAMKAAK